MAKEENTVYATKRKEVHDEAACPKCGRVRFRQFMGYTNVPEGHIVGREFHFYCSDCEIRTIVLFAPQSYEEDELG